MANAAIVIDELVKLMGTEQSLDALNRHLASAVRKLGSPVVGAHHITCSDETERQCIDAFARGFCGQMLPELKTFVRTPFRTSNLGARYEWNSLRVAEAHFATPASHDSFKTVVVKINGHVAATTLDGARQYGMMGRYGCASHACGALHAVLDGCEDPFADEIQEVMASEGKDRLKVLREQIGDDIRALTAAIVSARLQARSAVMEAQDYAPTSPTVYIIVPAVTVNQSTANDTELLIGVYIVDKRQPQADELYRGLGDDPTRYEIEHRHGKVYISDDSAAINRVARNHRAMIAHALSKHVEAAPPPLPDERTEAILAEAGMAHTLDRHALRTVLKGLLLALMDASPVPAAMLLFGGGVAGVYQAYRAHRIARDVSQSTEARHIIAEVHDEVDQLPPEQARYVLELLTNHYKR
jgi:hypothetical protein